MSAVLNVFEIPSRYYTCLLFGLMVKFGPLVFYLFGPPVFIFSVIRFQSSDPVSPKGEQVSFKAKNVKILKINKAVGGII